VRSRSSQTQSLAQRIDDPELRQAVYQRRKNALFRRATELSTMCDADVAIIMFGPDGELSQFSSSSMEETLRQYSRSCTQIHEIHTRDHFLNKRVNPKSTANGSEQLPMVGGRHVSGNKRSRFAPQHSLSNPNGRERVYPSNHEKETRDTAEAMLAMTRGVADPESSSKTISVNEEGEEGDLENVKGQDRVAMVESMEREIDKIRAKKAAAAKNNESLKSAPIKQDAHYPNPSMEPFEALAAALAGAPLHCQGTHKHNSVDDLQDKPQEIKQDITLLDSDKTSVLNTPAVKITPPVAASLEAPPPLGLAHVSEQID
jgi:hypothetical protein